MGNSLAPFRFLTPFSIRSSRRLRNSLRSDILGEKVACPLFLVPQLGEGCMVKNREYEDVPQSSILFILEIGCLYQCLF